MVAAEQASGRQTQDISRRSAPRRAISCAQARRRALLTVAVTFRRRRSPRQTISLSSRYVVGADATVPNSSRWSPITWKALIIHAPSATAHARSANTRPRSWPPSGDGSAADSPGVRRSGPKAAAAALARRATD